MVEAIDPLDAELHIPSSRSLPIGGGDPNRGNVCIPHPLPFIVELHIPIRGNDEKPTRGDYHILINNGLL